MRARNTRFAREQRGLPRQNGFTLIELLVVIAIIAILAAILFPVFARARSKARQTACTSNVKNLAMGILMYAQDYDETYMRSNQDALPAECNAAPGGCWSAGFVFRWNCPLISKRGGIWAA